MMLTLCLCFVLLLFMVGYVRSKHRFKLLKAAGAEALAASGSNLWEDVTAALSANSAG